MRIKIPKAEFERVFSRSSGPGGQNVNKVNSKVTIRLPESKWQQADWIPQQAKAQLFSQSFKYLTKSGELLIQSSKTRSQAANLEDCFLKLESALAAASFQPAEPSQQSKAKWERLARAGRSKALESKRQHSQIKASRKKDF